jgi:hypothetical protein
MVDCTSDLRSFGFRSVPYGLDMKAISHATAPRIVFHEQGDGEKYQKFSFKISGRPLTVFSPTPAGTRSLHPLAVLRSDGNNKPTMMKEEDATPAGPQRANLGRPFDMPDFINATTDGSGGSMLRMKIDPSTRLIDAL